MNKKEVKGCLETLNKIKDHCRFENCNNCIFGFDLPCMFFNSPYAWNLGELEEETE